jgi:hypothetical protein
MHTTSRTAIQDLQGCIQGAWQKCAPVDFVGAVAGGTTQKQSNDEEVEENKQARKERNDVLGS